MAKTAAPPGTYARGEIEGQFGDGFRGGGGDWAMCSLGTRAPRHAWIPLVLAKAGTGAVEYITVHNFFFCFALKKIAWRLFSKRTIFSDGSRHDDEQAPGAVCAQQCVRACVRTLGLFLPS
jgi:hypothetical protein